MKKFFTGIIIFLALIFLGGWHPISVNAQPFAYITNCGDTVSVIDTATNTVTTTIPVPGGGYGVAVHPTGSTVYVVNTGPVSVIDTATNTVTKTIEGDFGIGIAVHPDGSKVYVAEGYNSLVDVIDVATNTVTNAIPVEGGTCALGLFIGPAVPVPICKCDFPPADGDIDGFDLAAYKANNASISLSEFAEEFGRINCQ